ncbi:MAG: glycosyltransferase family 39 protein [candidate division WOR-3 bacterium]
MNRKLIYLIFLSGFLIRFLLYIQRRDLWHDEAALLMNLKEKSFVELINEKLEYNQMAPLFFLILNKVSVILDNDKNNELVIRFLPFLFSLLSFFIFYFLIKEIDDNIGFLLISLLVFLISETLLLYSSEFKHYSLDVFTTCLFLLICFKFLKDYSLKYSILFFLSGLILPFFSFTIFFFYPSIILVSFYHFYKNKTLKKIYFLIFSSLIFLVFSIFYYKIFLFPYKEVKGLVDYWNKFYFNPFKISEYVRFLGVFISIFHGTLGLRVPILVFLLFMNGLSLIYRKDKILFLFFVICILTVSSFSFLRIYPFHGRLLLFLVPVLICIISTNYSIKNLFLNKIFYIAFFIIFVKTFFYDLKLLLYPHRIEIKKAISTLKRENVKYVYVSGSLVMPFKIYEKNIKVIEKNQIFNYLKNNDRFWLILDKREIREFKEKNFFFVDTFKYFNVYICKIKYVL